MVLLEPVATARVLSSGTTAGSNEQHGRSACGADGAAKPQQQPYTPAVRAEYRDDSGAL